MSFLFAVLVGVAQMVGDLLSGRSLAKLLHGKVADWEQRRGGAEASGAPRRIEELTTEELRARNDRAEQEILDLVYGEGVRTVGGPSAGP